MSHKILRNIRFLLVLVALLVAVLVADALGLFAGADRFFYDTFLRLRGSRVCSNRIVIVAIDAQTLAALGRWPLARTYYAEMLNRLGEARFVGFDLLFMEPSSDR
jgi:CHASE2 domain-containing sensor protein